MPVRTLSRWYARRARFLFVERGLRGGSKPWLVFGGIFVAAQAYKRFLGRMPQVLTIDTLEPGQSITVTAIRPPTRADKRAARRARR